MKFIHTADNHIDAPLTSLTPDKALQRKIMRRNSFSSIIDFAISSSVDMLLIAGDLFDRPDPAPSSLAFCCDEFRRLGKIPVFISLGNHDYRIPTSDFPENIHIFSHTFERISCKDTIVTGVSFCGETADFSSSVPPVSDSSKHNILLIHGDILTKSDYNPLDCARLSTLGYDYIALGHIHSFHRSANFAYPGCHDASGFDELGEKGFISGFLHNHSLSVDFIPSSSVVYDSFDFDISDYTSSSQIASALELKISNGAYRINLTGILKSDFIPNTDYITSVLSQKAFFVSVSDKTIPAAHLSDSDLFRLFSERISSVSDPSVASLALKYGICALKGMTDDI